MADFLRVVLFFVSMLPSLADAVVPLRTRYKAETPNISAVYDYTQQGVCEKFVSAWLAHNNITGATNIIGENYSCKWRYLSNNYSHGITAEGNICPDHSTLAPGGAACVCDTGYVESVDGQSCRLPPDKCEFLEDTPFGGTAWIDMGIRTREQMWALPGKKEFLCPPEGCRVEGVIQGCGRNARTGQTYCDLVSNTYTGESCTPRGDDDPPPTDPPDDEPPDNKPPAPCPKGQCPGQVNGVDVCVPCGDTADGPPPKEPPDPNDPPDPDNPEPPKPGEPGSGSNSSSHTSTRNNDDGGTTITRTDKDVATRCVGDKCTTTTTTTTTTTDYNPDGSPKGPPRVTRDVDANEESKGSFCKENPTSWMCKGPEESLFGGSCGGNFECKGDAIQCAIARDQLRRHCQLMDDRNMGGVAEYDGAKGRTGNQTDELPGNEVIGIGGYINQDSLIGGGGLNDVHLSYGGRSLVLPLSQLAPYISFMGNIAVAIALIVAARIITR